MNFEDELLAVMASRNFYIQGNINWQLDGKFQRFASPNGRPRKKDLFVVLHDYDRGATFGDWHYQDDWCTHWNSAYGKPTTYEIIERQKKLEIQKTEAAYRRSKCEWRARTFWNKFYCNDDVTQHPYVIRKHIIPYYAKQCRSWLLVPVTDIEHKLMTVQIIKPDGFKRVWKGTSHKGLMTWLSDPLPAYFDKFIYLCEGYATGCTIKEALDVPVVCALSAKNLMLVGNALRKHFPNSGIMICADNDSYGDYNIGIECANATMNAIGMPMRNPCFKKYDISSKPTDFNDLLALAGKDIVRQQLNRQHK